MKKTLLVMAIGICLLFSLINFVTLVYEYTPPFNEGDCVQVLKRGMIKIEKNHILRGYSELSQEYFGGKQETAASFVELRNSAFEKVECQ